MATTAEKARAAGRATQLRIIEACEQFWTAQEQGKKDKSMCNTFVIAVAGKLGITIRGPSANAIYDELSSPRSAWRPAGRGADAAKPAGLLARAGQLVVAATKGDGHGHVAIVVDWDEIALRPRAYWGALHKGGKADGKLSESWSRNRLVPGVYTFTLEDWQRNPTIGTAYDSVEFFAIDVPSAP